MPTPTAATSSSNRTLKTSQVILFQRSILSRLDYKIKAFRRTAQRVWIMLSGCTKINLAHKGITEYLGLEGTHKSNFKPSLQATEGLDCISHICSKKLIPERSDPAAVMYSSFLSQPTWKANTFGNKHTKREVSSKSDAFKKQ